MDLLKKHKLSIITFLSGILYVVFAYKTERTEFYNVLVIWSLLFTGYYLIIRKLNYSTKHLAIISVLFRLLLLFAIPNLSQDFYRFIWDGRMIFEGLNPYISLPQNFILNGVFPVPQAEELYAGMGEMNGSHFTNYPPLNQFCFYIAALFANESILGAVIVMRILIILADIGILAIGYKLLENIKKNPKLIFLYILNPFVIIELTGNLHFEPVMLFFLVWSLYLMQRKKWIFAAFIFAFSINIKLIPLLFLPLFLKWFLSTKDKYFDFNNTPKLILFYSVVLGTSIVFFLPFYTPQLIDNYMNSVGLWFRNFEFNASFYYIFREIGYSIRGYNEIAIIGKITPIITIVILLIVTFFRENTSIRNLTVSMLLALSFYYFTTTTMHPWYLATLLILSVFTRLRYVVVWSFVVVLSYNAYANDPWQENLWFVALEYVIMYSYLIYEVIFKDRLRNQKASRYSSIAYNS